LALLAIATTAVSLDADAAVRGTLRVTSFPSGAEVWIDGAATGKATPATFLINTGQHQVMVKAPGGGWAPAEQALTVTTGLNVVALTLIPELTQGPPGPPGAGIPERATVEVDCGAGQLISPALQTSALRLLILVRGICEESISITRDDVQLVGVEEGAGAGLSSTSTSQNLVYVSGRNVLLRNLSLKGGRVGLGAGGGASFRAFDLDISGATWGVQASNSIGEFRDCRVHDNTNDGFNLHTGSSFSLSGTDVYGHVVGVGAGDGAQVEVGQGVTIRDSSWVGVWVANSTVHIIGATVTRNPQGVFLAWGANAQIRYSRVAGNASEGIVAMTGSVLALQEGAVVEDNGTGVSVQDNSSAIVNNGSVVRANVGDGIQLSGKGDLLVNREGFVENNGGWGVRCDPVPDVSGIHGWINPSQVRSNALGEISCPGNTVP